MPERPEVELIAQSKRGDQAAIGELFGRHYPSSLRLARGILRSEDESQDAVQVAYISAFQHLDSFRGDASFKTWITRIVVNSCLAQARGARHRVTWLHLDDPNCAPGPDVLASQESTPETSAWCREIASALAQAAAKLPGHLREAFTLSAISGLSVKDVAATLGLTEAAAKTRLFRARAGMRLHLRRVRSDLRRGSAPARPKPVNGSIRHNKTSTPGPLFSMVAAARGRGA